MPHSCRRWAVPMPKRTPSTSLSTHHLGVFESMEIGVLVHGGEGGGRNCTGTIRREVEARCFFDAQCCAPCPAGVGAADGIQPPSCSVCYLIDPHPVVSCSLSSALQKQSCPPISPPLGAGPENGKKRGRRERRAQLLLLLLHCPDLGNTTVGSGLCVWGGGCGCQGAWCK